MKIRSEARSLRRAAVGLQRRLEAVDEGLFQSLRSAIRGGRRGAALRQTIEGYVGAPAADEPGQAVVGYDSLDRLVDGILGSDALPEARREPEPEMVLDRPRSSNSTSVFSASSDDVESEAARSE